MEHHTVGHAVEGCHHHLGRHGSTYCYLLELIAVGKGIGAHKADSRPQRDTTQPFILGKGIGADDLQGVGEHYLAQVALVEGSVLDDTQRQGPADIG